MMHRYVIVVSTSDIASSLTRTSQRLQGRLVGWSKALTTSTAEAWVFSAPPSKLRHRQVGAQGCLIGLDFGSNAERYSSLTEDTWGAYVALSVDDDRRTASLVRDPTGRIQCWCLSLDDSDVFFSHYEDIYWLQDQQSSINWEYLTHHLSQQYLHGETTCLTGIIELLPGEEINYARGRPQKNFRWWPHEQAATPHTTPDEAQRAIRQAAEQAVDAWSAQYERIMLDLSGGLDSAIVLGLLRGSANHQNVIGINWLMPGEEGDERAFAYDAAKMHRVMLVEQPVSSQDVDLAVSFPRKLMRPHARILPVGYDEIGAALAIRHCGDAFLTGTGGDHLFYDHLPITAASDYFHHGGTATHYFDVAVALAQLSRKTVWDVTGSVLAHKLGRRPKIEDLGRRDNLLLSARTREASNAPRYMHPWAVEALKYTPPAKLRQILNLIELQRHYYRYGRADVAEEVFPLFSQPVVEACLRVPSHWFGAGGVQRGLARQAFADIIPDSIRTRRSKGGNSIYWLEFLGRRLPKIRDLLLGGRLAEKGLLDHAVLGDLLTPLGLAAGQHTSSLIACLSAELWVRQAEQDFSAAHNANGQPAVNA